MAILFGRLGYPLEVFGLIIGFMTLKGYCGFAKKIRKNGIIICMVILGSLGYISYCYFYSFPLMPKVFRGGIEQYGDLCMFYVFMLIGGLPLLKTD